MWALEMIDPQLPEKVRRDYDHRLGENSCIADLAAKIFQSLPTMLEDMDKKTNQRALSQPVHLEALARRPSQTAVGAGPGKNRAAAWWHGARRILGARAGRRERAWHRGRQAMD